ncbi:MAG: hypothetical protein SP4CHLAM5_00450 [Chlamydiia bacterium]|nr:hypothetical protein [Chlamydiia bacterium]MCH9617922.1 hypothetical protein [Chlamydiia bacterium]MCH9624138.1 hypothetical protein [Chlamydiia bacterium]
MSCKIGANARPSELESKGSQHDGPFHALILAESITTSAISQVEKEILSKNRKTDGDTSMLYTWDSAKKIAHLPTCMNLAWALDTTMKKLILFIEEKHSIHPFKDKKASILQIRKDKKASILQIRKDLHIYIKAIRAREWMNNKRFLSPYHRMQPYHFTAYVGGELNGPCNLTQLIKQIQKGDRAPIQSTLYRAMNKAIVDQILRLLEKFGKQSTLLKKISPKQMEQLSDFNRFFSETRQRKIRMRIRAIPESNPVVTVDKQFMGKKHMSRLIYHINLFVNKTYLTSKPYMVLHEHLKDNLLDIIDKLKIKHPDNKTLIQNIEKEFYKKPFFYQDSSLGHFRLWNYPVRLAFVLYNLFNTLYPLEKIKYKHTVYLHDERCFTNGYCTPFAPEASMIGLVPFNPQAYTLSIPYLNHFYTCFYMGFRSVSALNLRPYFSKKDKSELTAYLMEQDLIVEEEGYL